MGKTLPKTVETSQPPLNVLPVFIITEQTVLVQSVYVKQRSLLSLRLALTLAMSVSLSVCFLFCSILNLVGCRLSEQLIFFIGQLL